MMPEVETPLETVEKMQEPTWTRLVESIRKGSPEGMEELYTLFGKGVRFFLWRQMGSQDLDDKVHDIFLIITQAIQRGELREPERLMGYVRTVLRRQVASYIDTAVQTRRNQVTLDPAMNVSDRQLSPEREVIDRQNNEVAMRVLRSLPTRDREVLVRFYLDEQLPEQICRELKLTETQFRLIKSRAKARYGELGKRRFAQKQGFQK
jgi:RNA polymerase sigma-70 factor (ECF subfamily)